MATLRARYDAIGGLSTLAERTAAQRRVLQAALDAAEEGRFVVVAGNKHAPPFIEDAVARLAEQAIGEAVGVVMAPHWSAASVGEYQARAAQAGATCGLAVRSLGNWHLLPELVAFHAAGVRSTLERLGTPEAATKVVFTAHSLPERLLADDPYPDQLREGAAAIAAAAGLYPWAGWSLAWQSAGATPEPWRGPDIRTVIRELAATGRAEGVVVCPHGFTSDHLEVAYDLDIEAASVAADAGIAFGRSPMVNDDPQVLGGLAARIAATATGEASR